MTWPCKVSASAAPPCSASCCPAWSRCFARRTPTSARSAMPYVVFAGNVGDERTLAEIVERFRGAA